MSVNIKHLYIHVPFCRSKCGYCDFFSIPDADDKKKELYLDALTKELALHSCTLARPLDTLYFGGGSPMMLGTERLSRIMKRVLPLTSTGSEISIELNPEHLDDVASVIDTGFNRISIGVQSTVPSMLKDIKREFNINELADNIDRIRERKAGISLDFMFGLPGQGIKELKEDISFIIAQRPEHVSFYLFTPPHGYTAARPYPHDELIEEMFNVLHTSLTYASYAHYEVSNYALPGNICRHNMAYWKRSSYLGLGVAAHSFNAEKKVRAWHDRDIDQYIKNPTTYSATEIIDDEMEKNEKIMLGLRLLEEGIEEYLVPEKKTHTLTQSGLVQRRSGRLYVTTMGLPLLDQIISELVR